MQLDAFERLVSEWLDEPARDDLRRQIDAAITADPALQAVLDAWLRCDRLIKAPLVHLQDVDWPRLAAQIGTGVTKAARGEQDADAALDAALHADPGIDDRVDWARLRVRISTAIDQSTRQAAQRRRLYTMVAAASTMLAAAAALFLVLLPQRGTVVIARPPAGVAIVRVSPLAATDAVGAHGVAYARVAAVGVTDEPAPRFFVIDPVKPAAVSDDTGGYY